MYEIYADDLLIHSDITPLESKKVVNPHLTLEDSGAGSLEFVLPPMNDGYSQDVVKRMTTNIVVKCDGEFLWGGRILQDSFDFWNNRKIMCEGELAFLNDSIQPPRKYLSTETSIESFFYSLIDVHNSQVGENRQFEKGMVTVTDGDQQDDSDAIYRFTNYETTLACMNDKLVERLKGHLRVRHEDGHRFLDYISDETLSTNSQIVRFGVNLLDFSKNIDMSELATVICPRGNRLDLKEGDPGYIEGLEPYLTVESLGDKTEHNETTDQDEIWHQSGSMFVKNPTAVGNFGWVSTVIDWQNVTDANTLYSKAVKYLKDEQYEKMTLEIQAFDLKYLMGNDQPIKFLTKLRCVSEPHNMDHTFIVSKMNIDLTNPANSMYTLGTDVKQTLTQAASKVNQQILDEIEKIPSKNEIVSSAMRNAYQMIAGSENSYVHLISGPDGGIKRIEVTDGPTYDAEHDTVDGDPFPDSSNRWIWTSGGLGHSSRNSVATQEEPYPWTSSNVAMMMTGEIVADRIIAGTLRAINNLYTIDTQTGKIVMRYAELGPWKLNVGGAGLTDGSDAWVEPRKIACGQHGGTLIAMKGRSSGDHDGCLSVEVNENSDYCHVHYDYITKKDAQGNSRNVEWDSGSDEQLKEDIESLSLEEAMSIIKNTEPLTFRYKDGDKVKHYGFTAQRVDKECDELGLEKSFTETFGNPRDELKTIKYTQFIAPMLKVIQEQQKQIEALQNK